MTYALLDIPRPAFDEIRERLIDRQPETVRAQYASCITTDAAGAEILVIGRGSPSAIALRPVDSDASGAYPRPSWLTPGPGPMDGTAIAKGSGA